MLERIQALKSNRLCFIPLLSFTRSMAMIILLNFSEYYCIMERVIPTLQSFSSLQFSSVTQSCLTLCDPHELQHVRPPCPSPIPGVHSDSCPSSQWCHPAHLILCRPLLLLPPIPPSIRVFSNESTLCMRWPKYWSFSFSSVLPMNTQD